MMTADKKSFELHGSMSTLASRYDGFILDQFGVMHNGRESLPGAKEAIEKLHALGKRLVILSNSSSGREATIGKLPTLGFEPAHFCDAVTSGEETSHYVSRKFSNETLKKRRIIFLTWREPRTPSPMIFLEKCGPNLELTTNPAEADLVILHGVDVLLGPGLDGAHATTEFSLGNFFEEENFDLIDPILLQCSTAGLEMVCANPDYTLIRPNGSEANMPGKIARRYENKFGGSVRYFGKPHVPHFEACIKMLGLPMDKVVHVGDSLHHDIAGANATGIDSIFVCGGIHNKELMEECNNSNCAQNDMMEREPLSKLFATYEETPTHVVRLLRW